MDKRKYARHVSIVMLGTIVAQAVNLLSYPLIARTYAPPEFGIFAIFVTATAVPGIISCWRLELTIPNVGKRVFISAYQLAIFASALSGLFAGAFAFVASFLTSETWPASISLLIGLAVFLTGFCAASTMLLLRLEQFRATASGVVIRTTCAVAAQLALGLLWQDATGLIVGYCIGFGMQGAVLAWNVSRSKVWRTPSRRGMFALLKRYRRQIAIDVPSAMIGSLSVNLTPPLVAVLFGTGRAGIYAIAARLAILPMQVFTEALGQVFFQRAAKAYQERGTFWPEYRFNMISSGAISAFVVLAICLFAPVLAHLYLGAEWAETGHALVWISPMIGLMSLSMALATSVFVLKKVHWLLFLNIATICGQLLAFALSYLLALEFLPTLAILSVNMGLVYLAFVITLTIRVRNSGTRSAGPVAPGGAAVIRSDA